MTHILNKIYKQRSDGGNQVWYGELDRENGRYRTHAGKIGGVITTSEWTQCLPKNVGRSNATTAGEQAEFELTAMYKKRLEKEYHENLDNVGQSRFVEPMLADKWKDKKAKVKHGSLLFFQPKLDGFRATLQKTGAVTRSGKRIGGAFHIENLLASLFERLPELILDGELYNHDYHDKFQELSSKLKNNPKTEAERQEVIDNVEYHVYDIPSLANKNYSVRLEALQELFDNEPELDGVKIRLVETSSFIWGPDAEKEAEELMASALERGYEGGIIRQNLPYEFKRTAALLKWKQFLEDEFEIAKIEEGKGNWAGYAKRIWIVLPNAPIKHGDPVLNRDTKQIEKFDGTQKNCVRVSKSTPKGSQDYCKQLLNDADKVVGMMGTLQFFRYTEDGVPYLPNFKEIRWDK